MSPWPPALITDHACGVCRRGCWGMAAQGIGNAHRGTDALRRCWGLGPWVTGPPPAWPSASQSHLPWATPGHLGRLNHAPARHCTRHDEHKALMRIVSPLSQPRPCGPGLRLVACMSHPQPTVALRHSRKWQSVAIDAASRACMQAVALLHLRGYNTTSAHSCAERVMAVMRVPTATTGTKPQSHVDLI